MVSRRNFSKSIAGVGLIGLIDGSPLDFLGTAEAKTFPSSMSIKQPVYNRGRAPDAFLQTLIEWGRTEDDEVFAKNTGYDVYSHVSYLLGPWENLTQRKAAMLEVLRVLGGFESSWRWDAGVDVGKTEPNTECTEEAGIFQCSGNSLNYNDGLKQYMSSFGTMANCKNFIVLTKANKAFALGYCARLLRHTVKHHGPLNRRANSSTNARRSSIHPYLSKKAVREFEELLKA